MTENAWERLCFLWVSRSPAVSWSRWRAPQPFSALLSRSRCPAKRHTPKRIISHKKNSSDLRGVFFAECDTQPTFTLEEEVGKVRVQEQQFVVLLYHIV